MAASDEGARPQSLLRSLLAGSLAGLAATGVMSIIMLLARRAGLVGEQPPRKITGRMLDRISPFAARGRRDELAASAHVAFGVSVGGVFGLLRRLLPGVRGKLAGAAYGLAIYLVSYAGWLPALGLMPRPDRDRPLRQPALIGGHLAYGITLGILTRGLRRRIRLGA